MTKQDDAWLKRLKAIKPGTITAEDVEAYFYKTYRIRKAKKDVKVSEKEIAAMVSECEGLASKEAARRYFELAADEADTNVEWDGINLVSLKREQALLQEANGDQELARVFMKLTHNAYGRLGTQFMSKPLVHKLGFWFVLAVMIGSYFIAAQDLWAQTGSLAPWQQIALLTGLPLSLTWILKEERGYQKLLDYRADMQKDNG